MGRSPCCDKALVKKGPWSPEEDCKLREFIEKNGTGGNWIALPQKAGLRRCGKSCRLRWLNYLRPNLKHGEFSADEDRVICSLFASIGSRWSIIAAQLPGRTDNDIKNYWNTKLKKKLLDVLPQAKLLHHPVPSPLEPSPSSQTCYRKPPPSLSAATSFPRSQDFPNNLFLSHNDSSFPFLYQPKESPFFHGEQSGSSSDGSCSNQGECEYDRRALDSLFSTGLEENTKSFVCGGERGGLWGEPPLMYGLEDIKQLISCAEYNMVSNGLVP